MNWQQFEELTRKTMTQHFGVKLLEKNPRGFPKRFDLVSPDDSIVGDAKYLYLGSWNRLSSCENDGNYRACLAFRKGQCKNSFLGVWNQRDVPDQWLEKYGEYKHNVDFYFIDDNGILEKLE